MAIFQRHTMARRMIVLFLLTSTGVASMTPINVCAAPKASDHRAECRTSRACCCRTSRQKPVCCCQVKQETPVPSPVIPDGSGRFPKLLLFNEVASTGIGTVESETRVFEASQFLGSPLTRSVQSMYCTWRT